MNGLKNLFFKKRITSTTKQPIDSDTKDQKILCSKPISIIKKRLSIDTLKRFVPLRSLSDHAIGYIPHSTQVFSEGSVIFARSQESEQILYLLKGTIKLQPDSESYYSISAKDTRANLPLNTGKTAGATATATTEVTILAISGELNQLWSDKSREEVSCIDIIDIELPEELNGQQFFNSFSQAYRESKLSLPSLPHVAIKLKEAMANKIGVNEAVEIIQLDPPIVTKLIQVANSPLYAPITPITNCHDAVTRLGLEATRSLVLGISLKQLFKCDDKKLMKSMQELWKKSLYVSSLSFVLAAETGTINPEDALLAGLISDIGIIPLLHFAEENPAEYPEHQDLENAMPYLRAPVGTLVLHTLGFSEELTAIPHHAEDWFFDSGKELTITDIVILAKLHSYIGSKEIKDLPYINSIPAYSKLKKGKLAPDFSLQVLHKAQDRIKNAMQMLA